MTAKPMMIGLDTAFLGQVIAEGGTEARKLLAVQVSALLRDPETPLLEREQVVPIITKLAADKEVEVRKVLSEELRDVPRLAPDIVFTMVAEEDELSLEFLRNAASLDSLRMLAILQVGGESRQHAIAGRPDLSPEVQSWLAQKGQHRAVLALLDNQMIALKEVDFRKLYARFSDDADIINALLHRIDLPMDIRVTQARRVAGRMKQYVAEFPWAETANTFDTIDEAEDNTFLDILEPLDEAQSQNLSEFLAGKNLITPALILRAACTGRMLAVEHLLQYLCGYTRQRVRDMMYVRQGNVLRSALAKTGLPENCVGVLQVACSLYSQNQEDGLTLPQDRFGRKLLEALMLLGYQQSLQLRQQQVDFVARYANPAVRGIARKLKSNLARAA
jgi:uncharacterized protein (DUF2336 family)